MGSGGAMVGMSLRGHGLLRFQGVLAMPPMFLTGTGRRDIAWINFDRQSRRLLWPWYVGFMRDQTGSFAADCSGWPS